MKKEIGSIFPLSNDVLCQAESEQAQYSGDRIYYSLCREALFDIAKALDKSNKRVMIPAYTCQTVITPFEKAGWTCSFYSVRRDLRIDIQSLYEGVDQYDPSLIVVHPYFGMDLNSEEEKAFETIKEKGIPIVLDLTQCLFSTKEYSFASFIVASYRKWMPIPDGGYLIQRSHSLTIAQPEMENSDFTDREIAAMYLRGLYFENGEQRIKDISIRLSKMADHIAESVMGPHKMSKVAYNLLERENAESIQDCRFDNYSFLFHNIHESNSITKVCTNMSDVTTAPLYFTIFADNRAVLQRLLAQDSIYAPVIWPVEDEKVLIDDEVRFIYNHLLAIPCDQRFNKTEMSRVVDIINKF